MTTELRLKGTGDGGADAIAYAEAGPLDRPCVVLIPGGDGAVRTSAMLPVLGELSTTHRCVIVETRGAPAASMDPPGFGTDQIAADVIGVLDDLGIERTAVVGGSLGGMIGQHVAARLGGRLTGAVFALTSAGGDEFFTGLARHLAQLARVAPAEFGRAAALWGGSPEAFARIAALFDGGAARSEPLEGTARRFEAAADHDSRSVLSAISGRVAVVSAEHDAMLRPQLGDELARAISGASFHVIPAASHMVLNEDPLAFARSCRRFFAGDEFVPGGGPA